MHYSILLTQLLHELVEIDGRKKFQKIVHLLKSAGAPFDERFEYALFGPYSATLRAEIDSLCEHGYFVENSSGSSYSFTAGDRFQAIVEEDFLKASPDWAGFAKVLNEKSSSELEALSTVIFLMEHGYDESKIETKFSELKAHLIKHFGWARTAADQIEKSHSNWSELPKALAHSQ